MAWQPTVEHETCQKSFSDIFLTHFNFKNELICTPQASLYSSATVRSLIHNFSRCLSACSFANQARSGTTYKEIIGWAGNTQCRLRRIVHLNRKLLVDGSTSGFSHLEIRGVDNILRAFRSTVVIYNYPDRVLNELKYEKDLYNCS